jgi:hypothetical protein
VMAGLDARPMILAGQVQPPEEGGWPRLDGHTTWFETTAADVGQLVSDTAAWVNAHPAMRVEPAPSPPVVLVQSWNELQEGAILVPTQEHGYAFAQAIASAVGLPWNALHARHFAATRVHAGAVIGTLTVDDHWTPCETARLQLQQRSHGRWTTVRTASTRAGGSFAIHLPTRGRSFRVGTQRSIRYGQTCEAATSPAMSPH